jgi:hypothetical protein
MESVGFVVSVLKEDAAIVIVFGQRSFQGNSALL